MKEGYSLNYTIYNGYFARYRVQAKAFINESYKCALALGNFLTGKAKLTKSFATDAMTAEAINLYCDYNILKVYDDFRGFLMDSSKGLRLTHRLFTDTVANLKDFNKGLLKKSYATLTVEQATQLKDSFSRINNERRINDKAISKFSVYKFVKTYNGSIEAYEKSNQHAPAYYDRIVKYMAERTSASTLKNLRIYLVEEIVA